ncbi:MAG TPA: hypothetical protein VF624_03125 [Tepidisphaeraceae bacterium]|jgi:hypothetical protein
MPLSDLIDFLHQHLAPAAIDSPLPLLMIATFCVASVEAFIVTRGKECLVCGYASLLYIVPLLR